MIGGGNRPRMCNCSFCLLGDNESGSCYLLFSFVYTRPHYISTNDPDYGYRVNNTHCCSRVSPNSHKRHKINPGDVILKMYTAKASAKLDSATSVIDSD